MQLFYLYTPFIRTPVNISTRNFRRMTIGRVRTAVVTSSFRLDPFRCFYGQVANVRLDMPAIVHVLVFLLVTKWSDLKSAASAISAGEEKQQGGKSSRERKGDVPFSLSTIGAFRARKPITTDCVQYGRKMKLPESVYIISPHSYLCLSSFSSRL